MIDFPKIIRELVNLGINKYLIASDVQCEPGVISRLYKGDTKSQEPRYSVGKRIVDYHSKIIAMGFRPDEIYKNTPLSYQQKMEVIHSKGVSDPNAAAIVGLSAGYYCSIRIAKKTKTGYVKTPKGKAADAIDLLYEDYKDAPNKPILSGWSKGSKKQKVYNINVIGGFQV